VPSPYRPLLLALAALVAVRAGAQAPPSAAGPRSTLHARAFESPALGTTKHALVYLPPSYGAAPARRYPVLYYLHGMEGSEGDWARRGRLARAMDSLAAAGMPEAIVVMPDGDDGWYTTWNSLASLSGCEARVPPDEPRERYCVPWARYDDYVARDVVAWVDSTFRTRADRAHRGIAGLSMGGYGAVLLAAQYPDVFGAAASHSGALAPALRGGGGAPSAAAIEAAWGPRYWRYLRPVFGRDTVGWWARDPARLLRALRRTRPALAPALHVDVGTDDPFLSQNRAFRDSLAAMGIEHRYAEWPGGHGWPYWRAHLAESLAWLLRRVSEPGGGS
jgi:enterochelin esterase-like enzyme